MWMDYSAENSQELTSSRLFAFSESDCSDTVLSSTPWSTERMMTFSGLAKITFLAIAFLAGCTTKSEVFPGRTPEQVWTVMATVAQEPDYENWILLENNVWLDPNYDRIEINRRLKRDYHDEGANSARQVETLNMQFVLEKTDPPAVTGTMRNRMIPVKARAALEEFFAEMHDLLEPAIEVQVDVIEMIELVPASEVEKSSAD
jgi:hypothetical protein